MKSKKSSIPKSNKPFAKTRALALGLVLAVQAMPLDAIWSGVTTKKASVAMKPATASQ